jgi:hypothetical protein
VAVGSDRMMPDFIFMLTQADRTVPDAQLHLDTVLAAGVRHIGFKDIGLPQDELAALTLAIKAAGATAYLEVVSLDAQSECRSAEMAVALGVDILLGGTRPDIVGPIVRKSDIRYMPFPGTVVGHPSILTGSHDDIVESARALVARDDVDGLDLLAYRFAGNVEALMLAVCKVAAPKPVIVAGSIANAARIVAVRKAGAAGFTIGTAAFEARFPAEQNLTGQLSYITTAIRENFA